MLSYKVVYSLIHMISQPGRKHCVALFCIEWWKNYTTFINYLPQLCLRAHMLIALNVNTYTLFLRPEHI
jgi:hypothetical protein